MSLHVRVHVPVHVVGQGWECSVSLTNHSARIGHMIVFMCVWCTCTVMYVNREPSKYSMPVLFCSTMHACICTCTVCVHVLLRFDGH